MWKFATALIIYCLLANLDLAIGTHTLLMNSGPSMMAKPKLGVNLRNSAPGILSIKAMKDGNGGNENHHGKNGHEIQHSQINGGPIRLENHGNGNEPIHQNKPKMGKNALQKMAELPLRALFAVLRPIEFVAQVVIMAPLIWHSFQMQKKYSQQRKSLEKANKTPERVYFILAIEKLMELANSGKEGVKNLEQKVGHILETNLQKINKKSEFNLEKLKKIIVEVLEGKPNIRIPAELNAAERLFVQSLKKGIKMEKELAKMLGQFGGDAARLAAKGAVSMLAILLAPIEIGANAVVVLSLKYSQHKQQKRANSYYNQKPSFKVEMKLRIIYAMGMFEDWLEEIGKKSGKNLEKLKGQIMGILAGDKVKMDLERENNILEEQFERILREKGEGNAKDLEGILDGLKRHEKKEIQVNEVDAGESEIDVDGDALGDSNSNSPLNINGLGFGEFEGENEEGGRRRKRNINGQILGLNVAEMDSNGGQNIHLRASVCWKKCKIGNVMEEKIEGFEKF